MTFDTTQDRSRNRLNEGDEVRVLGYFHGSTFEPKAIIVKKYERGLVVQFADGESSCFDAYQLVK